VICPKCSFEQPDGGAECLRCGVVFARLLDAQEAGGGMYRPVPASLRAEEEEEPRGLEWWKAVLFPPVEEVEPAHFWGRAMLGAFLFLWGWRFLLSSVQDNYSGESFLHLVNLPFHEAGHVIFGPFGELLRALGGTLGQLLIPTICLGTFLLKNRDAFGSAVSLWWLAENFMDIGPYIADARSGQLLLLGGVTARDVPGYHDWENVLITLDLMQYDQVLGGLSYGLGRVLMLAAFAWGGWELARQRRNLTAGAPRLAARDSERNNF
jgi:hypothetical protein